MLCVEGGEVCIRLARYIKFCELARKYKGCAEKDNAFSQ